MAVSGRRVNIAQGRASAPRLSAARAVLSPAPQQPQPAVANGVSAPAGGLRIGGAAPGLATCPKTGVATPWSPALERLGGLENLPPWATDLVAGGAAELTVSAERVTGLELTRRVQQHGGVLLLSTNVRGADYLDGPDLQRCVRSVYSDILAELDAHRLAPFRFWNFMPSINDAAGDDAAGPVTRYMQFNFGRSEALSSYWGGENEMMKLVCTATGIGHVGADFSVHVLASRGAPVEVENPRQVPAYKYSSRWGPKAPSFSRATVWSHPTSGRRLLVAGGTASVLGEDTAHIGNAHEQFEETMRNLTALLRSGQEAAGRSAAAVDEEASRWSRIPPYATFTVYYRHAADVPWMRSAFREHAAPGTHVEFLPAVVCRRELLVEIEAVAELDPADNSVVAPHLVTPLMSS